MKRLAIFTLSIILGISTIAPMTASAYTKPAGANVLVPTASGSEQTTQGNVTIDSSNKSQGYIMIKYTGSNSNVKAKIIKGTEYLYSIPTNGSWATFPLSEGSGNYTIQVYENVSGNQYSMAASKTISANIPDEKMTFLYPNQFVNFTASSNVTAIAAQVAAPASDQFGVVTAVFDYVISNMTYDNAKAANPPANYIPDIDAVLAARTGICFDYAAAMTAMLRAENIPTKLVIGYTGSVYHAWVSVYLDGQGWVDNVIYFDGVNWTLMDPTFGSSNNKSEEILAYMANSANYQTKYCY